MAAEKTQNQALEQTRDSILRNGQSFGRELLNLVVMPSGGGRVLYANSTDDCHRPVRNPVLCDARRIRVCDGVSGAAVALGFSHDRAFITAARAAVGRL